MQYRRFGRTELAMPVFSCGGMRYQHSWQDGPIDEIPRKAQDNLAATVHRALELGINHIETARGYGTSEVQLGQVLPSLPREDLIVQTKGGPSADAEAFRKTCEHSLKTLKLDYVDLFALHGVNTMELLEQSLRPGGCVEIAKRLQEQGKFRFVGFSTHAPTEVILRAVESRLFDYVNLHWYYIHQSNWPAIEAAKKQDMGVFIISPSDKGGKLYEPPQKLVDLCAPVSPMVFNDLFCLSHPEVHTLSIGAARPDDFDEHLKTLPLLERADEILSPILERLEREAIAQLGEEWYRTWDVGLPTHEETPGNINIPLILQLHNLVVAFDMLGYGRMRYNLLGNGGHWLPGNKADKLDQYDLSECLANSPHAEEIPRRLKETHEWLMGETKKRLSQS